MERLGWAVKWNKKLYEDEPDVMLEHPSVMSDSGLPEDERAMNGLAERVVEDIRAAGVTNPELIIVDTVDPHTREPLLSYTSRRRMFVLGHAEGSPDNYEMPALRSKLPPLSAVLGGQPADGSPTMQVSLIGGDGALTLHACFSACASTTPPVLCLKLHASMTGGWGGG